MTEIPSADKAAAAPDTTPEPRISPLNEAHLAAGASFTDFAGWQMPVRYTSDLAEHRAVRESAGLFDLSHMGEIVVLGPEAGAALDAALAGSLSTIPVGRAKYSLLLTEDGGVIDDLVVYRTGDDRFLVVANAANRAVVAEELRRRSTGFDTVVEDESDDVALIAIQGPKALEILLRVPLLAVEGGHPDGRDAAEAVARLGYYRALAGSIGQAHVLLARTGYTGEDGFELFCSPEKAPELWAALLEAGGDELTPCGLACRDTLRLEAGMPLYGHELSRETLPVQAGLARVVDLNKANDFVGRGAIQRGPTADARVLVGLRGEGKRAARAGYEVLSTVGAEASTEAGTVIGVVTSGALSPTLGYPIAMAYIDPVEVATPGARVLVNVRGQQHPYDIVPLPFYKRPKK